MSVTECHVLAYICLKVKQGLVIFFVGQIVGGVAVGLQDHPAVYGGTETL